MQNANRTLGILWQTLSRGPILVPNSHLRTVTKVLPPPRGLRTHVSQEFAWKMDKSERCP